MCISDTTFKSWMQGDLTHVEHHLTEDITHALSPFHHANTLAQRSLVNTRLQRSHMAIDDAKRVIFSHQSSHIILTIASKSIEIQRSVIGFIANAIACLGAASGEHEAMIDAFDVVFKECLPHEKRLLLLIKVCACRLPRCWSLSFVHSGGYCI